MFSEDVGALSQIHCPRFLKQVVKQNDHGNGSILLPTTLPEALPSNAARLVASLKKRGTHLEIALCCHFDGHGLFSSILCQTLLSGTQWL
jgi:hypothetical protein